MLSDSLRCNAIRALGISGDPNLLPVFLNLVHDVQVRESVFDAISVIGGQQAITCLIDLLHRTDEPELREQVIATLGSFRHRTVRDYVLEQLRGATMTRLRLNPGCSAYKTCHSQPKGLSS